MYREELSTTQRDGFELVAYMVEDEITNNERYEDQDEPPNENDTPEFTERYWQRKAAYDAGQWSYVGIIVEVYLRLEGTEDVELGSASLWAVESDYREEVVAELQEEALDEAKQHLQKILDSAAVKKA